LAGFGCPPRVTEIRRLDWQEASGGEPDGTKTDPACTNVPKAPVTVADALAVLQAAGGRAGEARTIRRALLAVLAAIEGDD
jgi:hypothetical protein